MSERDLSGSAYCIDCQARAAYPRGDRTKPLVIVHLNGCPRRLYDPRDMKRLLSLTFEVTDDAITDDELYDLADRIVTDIDPDPPVLVYDGAAIQVVKS
jgi:hypothetical protein